MRDDAIESQTGEGCWCSEDVEEAPAAAAAAAVVASVKSANVSNERREGDESLVV